MLNHPLHFQYYWLVMRRRKYIKLLLAASFAMFIIMQYSAQPQTLISYDELRLTPATTQEPKVKSNPLGWSPLCRPHPSSTAPVHVIEKDMETADYSCVNFESLQPTVKICIHKVKEDRYVSGAIAKGEFWEPENVKFFQKLLQADPDLHVIDIGANIGEYTLVAAHAGRKVLAVEARLLHVHMLQQSLRLNHYHDRVTLVYNAISDSYGQVTLGTYYNNQGGTHIANSKQTKVKSGLSVNVKNNMTSTMILMSDLVAVTNFSKALMKIDIEGYEDTAFRCAERLFSMVYIPVVLMEWTAMAKKSPMVIEPFVQWIQSKGYKAFLADDTFQHPLNFSEWQKWPHDILLKMDEY